MITYTISKDYKFEAAHKLPGIEKCKNLHGHSYIFTVTLQGDKTNGMVMDYNILKPIVKEAVVDKLDHTYLNDIIEFPTAENIAEWIGKALTPALGILLKSISVQETATSHAKASYY